MCAQEEERTSAKQLRFIEQLAGWKGVDVDLDEVAKWSSSKASDKIDELLKRKSVRQDGKDDEPEHPPIGQEEHVREFSAVRFGMCAKLVIQHSDPCRCIREAKEYVRTVGELYELVTAAEEAIKASFSGGAR